MIVGRRPQIFYIEYAMAKIMRVMRGNRWYTVEELEKHVKSRRVLGDALRNLGYHQKVIGVRVPGLGQRRLWHRTVPVIDRSGAPDGLVNVFAIPWWMKQTFVTKFSQLRRKGMIKRELPRWLRAEMIVEQHLIRNGLYYARPRRSLGFGCNCSWQVNPEHYPRTRSRADGMYTFGVDFIARVKIKTILPPFDTSKSILGVRGWIGEDRRGYEVWTGSKETRTRLASVAEFRANPQTGMIAGPTSEQLTAQTAAQLMEGAADVPALTMFLPIKCKFRLLSKRSPEETPP